jgi:protein disulfide-isomerase A6
VKFFPFGSTVPVNYEGPREVDSMLSYLNLNANTFRALTGELTELAGRVKSLDDIIATAASLDHSLVDALKTATEAIGDSAAVEHVKEYLKTAEKVATKGVEYIEKEIARLSGMISKATVTAEKKSAFMLRRNILKAFQL